MEKVSDELDFAIVSMVTSVLIDECSAMDVKASAVNALDPVLRRVVAAAKRSAHCQVIDCYCILGSFLVMVFGPYTIGLLFFG